MMETKAATRERSIGRLLSVRQGSRLDPWWALVAVVVVLFVLLVTLSPDPYWRVFNYVRDGLYVTIILTLVSFVFVLALGMLGGLGRLSKNPVIHLIASLYVELVRGIPLLVQLIWWYYAFPVIIMHFGTLAHVSVLEHFQANAIALAIVGLVFCYGAYMSEIYRAGIQSIPKGQMEAARSLGMSYFQSMRHVVMPQAIRVILPPVGNEFISLLKDSSLVSVVAVADMTRRGREYMAAHFNPIEVWSVVALLYLIMTLFSARVVAWMERRTKFER